MVNNFYRGIEGNKYEDSNITAKCILSIFDSGFYNHPDIYIDYYYGSAVDGYISVLAKTYNDSLTSSVYLKQIATAKKNLSEPVYNYLLMRFMRRISRWGNSSFNDVAFLINNELKKAKLDLDTRNKMAKCNSDFKMLSKYIQDFGNIRLKTIDNKYLHFSDVIEKKKYVFLDFWASWCGACMPEFPYLKKYQLKYPQIQFIGLSIDENQQSWKTSFNKLAFSKSSSFLLVDGVKSKIVLDYNIQAIPRFLLFDSLGKCISASDIRPSDLNFDLYIKQLLSLN